MSTTSQDLARALADAGEAVAQAGGRDGPMTQRGCAPKAAVAIAEERALRVYGYLTGQLQGPIQQSAIVRSEPELLKQLQALWLGGLLVGLYAQAEVTPKLGHLQLAEGARTLDSLSSERGSASVWDSVDLDGEAAVATAQEVGGSLAEQLAVGSFADDGKRRLIAAVALWQDGLAVSLLARRLASRAHGGEGPRPGQDIPLAEQ